MKIPQKSLDLDKWCSWQDEWGQQDEMSVPSLASVETESNGEGEPQSCQHASLASPWLPEATYLVPWKTDPDEKG